MECQQPKGILYHFQATAFVAGAQALASGGCTVLGVMLACLQPVVIPAGDDAVYSRTRVPSTVG
eukprot:2396593-Rhodomonas_salina.1